MLRGTRKLEMNKVTLMEISLQEQSERIKFQYFENKVDVSRDHGSPPLWV